MLNFGKELKELKELYFKGELISIRISIKLV
jgi:hypothetical protein